jgi:hypothetical protein
VENVTHRKLHHPQADPNSHPLAATAPLEQRLALLSPHETAQNFGTHRRTQYRRLRIGDLAGIRDNSNRRAAPHAIADDTGSRMTHHKLQSAEMNVGGKA